MNQITMEVLDSQESKVSRIEIGFNRILTLADCKLLAFKAVPVYLSQESYGAMTQSHSYLKQCIDHNMPVYGVNTNFGDQVRFVDHTLQTKSMESYESTRSRQENIIKSLTCSLGNSVPPECVRVSMMLRAHCLAQGYSGINPLAVDAMVAFLNAGIIPNVNCYGSIGASGDLIPLASIASAMIGENVDVFYRGEIMKAPSALKQAGLQKYQPTLRDGLAMINGTSFMTAIASLATYNLNRLFHQMLIAIGMSLESMLVISSAYHPLVHQLKHHIGEIEVNNFLLHFWEGSQLLSNLQELREANKNAEKNSDKPARPVQDYYSLRSISQGFGSFQENLARATRWIEEEMNSVNDNPIIDAAHQEIHHGANFMGYYITEACDTLKMEIAKASTWIHALLANMVHPRKNQDLPANLVNNPGQNNGFRSLQLLAAALAVQNRKLAQVHQAYTLPTEGDNQDVNSLGTHAALDLRESVNNLERLTAILLLASAQALEFRGIEKASTKAQSVFHLIRQYSPMLVECRPMTDELNTIIQLLQEEKI